MARFERLLIPIIAVVMLAAFLLEDLGAQGVRRIALGLGILLVAAIVVGMYHRVRKKSRQEAAVDPPTQTSNEHGGRPPD
jgi:hypothetical protein